MEMKKNKILKIIDKWEEESKYVFKEWELDFIVEIVNKCLMEKII